MIINIIEGENMGIVIGVGMLIVDAVMFYVIYSDRLADKLKCRRIEEINLFFVLIGFVIWNIAGIIFNEKIELFGVIFSIALIILIFWGLFLRNMYAHMLTIDSIPYFNNFQKKGIYRTLLRNTLFLCVLILQIILSLYFPLS